MKHLMKIALCYELGNKRPKPRLIVEKVAASMGLITNKGVPQPKKTLHPKGGDMPLHDVDGSVNAMASSSKSPRVYDVEGDVRTMNKKKLQLDAGTGVSIHAGRKMNLSQAKTRSADGKEKKGKAGPLSIKKSTGGLRKMNKKDLILSDAAGRLKRSKQASLKEAAFMRPEEVKARGRRIDNKDVRYMNKKWVILGQETEPSRVKYLGGSFWLMPQGSKAPMRKKASEEEEKKKKLFRMPNKKQKKELATNYLSLLV